LHDQGASQRALGPRTAELGRLARLTRAAVVSTASTTPPAMINFCWVAVSSDHFLLLGTPSGYVGMVA
jgi:hypothetical protein